MRPPRRGARRAHWSIILAFGCSSHEHSTTTSPDGDLTPGLDACAVRNQVEVPLDLFGELSDPPELVPFGDRFAVVDAESVTPEKVANAALVSWQGVDSQSHFALDELCPDGVCRNVHGTALLASAAGHSQFLLAEQGSSLSMAAYPLRALAWDGAGGPAQITPLFATRVTAITTRAAMQSSRDAGRALFVLGNIDVPSLEAVAITAGATLVGPPLSTTLPATPWDCLEAVRTDAAGAASVVTELADGADALWSVRELDAGGNIAFEADVPVPVGGALGFADCPTVVENADGFHAQWISTTGATVIASALRDAEPAAAPVLLALDTSPGTLAGIFRGDFLFLATLDGGGQGFIRVTRDGNPGGPGVVLPALPASTLEHRRATPRVLNITGSSFALSYELDSTRVFEEWSCP